MRLPIGTTDVSASGGTATLIGRRGEGWAPIAPNAIPLADAVAAVERDGHVGAHADPVFESSVLSSHPLAASFAPGEPILWRYGRFIETARVIRDDERGLVVWIPSGSARLESVPAAGGSTRDVALAERFRVPWTIRESRWRGPGVVRVAPTGRPWSVWFFRHADGTADGAYVNLELPHRRSSTGDRGIFSRDLVLDLWVDAGHPGSEDVWLKDADELVAAVDQGRFTADQADAVRAIADHAAREFIAEGEWPLDESWAEWTPTAEMDAPIELPDSAAIAAARARSGRTGREG